MLGDTVVGERRVVGVLGERPWDQAPPGGAWPHSIAEHPRRAARPQLYPPTRAKTMEDAQDLKFATCPPTTSLGRRVGEYTSIKVRLNLLR